MATPFFNTNYRVASTQPAANLIAQAGAVQGQMFLNLGKIAADSLDKFRENKKKKEEEDFNFKTAKGFLIQNPEVASSLFNASDEEEITAVAKGLSKSPDMGKFIGGLSALESEEAARQSRINKEAAVNRFAQRSMGMIQNPLIGDLKSEIEQNNQTLERLLASPESGSSGIPRPSDNRLIASFTKQNEDLENKISTLESEVPMTSLDSNAFLRSYGQPQSPEEALLLQNELIRRQSRDDANVGRNMDALIKGAQFGQMTGKQRGDVFANRVIPSKPYYFDENEAKSDILDQSNSNNITLSSDQLNTALSRSKIIDLKELRSAADRQVRELNLVEPIAILEASEDLNAFIDQGGPLSANVAKEKLARMVQPIGILTESDLARVGGSAGFRDRIDAAIAKATAGKLDEKTEQYLRETATVFRDRAAQLLREKQGQGVEYLSSSFGITPDEAKQYTQFGQILKNIPAGADPSQPPSNQPGTRRLILNPYSGQQEQAEVVATKPDGTLILKTDEGLIEVDPSQQ